MTKKIEWTGYERCPDCGALKNKQSRMCHNTGCWYEEKEGENELHLIYIRFQN